MYPSCVFNKRAYVLMKGLVKIGYLKEASRTELTASVD